VGSRPVVEHPNLHLGAAVGLALFHYKVLVGERRNLGQVGDAQNLLAAASDLSFCPTASAARPPMPMSISSKTRVRA
jgi:hypothetical protein